MEFPKATDTDTIMIDRANGTVIQHADGRILGHVDVIDIEVLQLADGTAGAREIAALATIALGRAVDSEQVWASLDRLADLGLIENRVTPPTGDRIDAGRRAALIGLVGAVLPIASSLSGKRAMAAPPPSSVADEPRQKKTQGSTLPQNTGANKGEPAEKKAGGTRLR